MLFFWVAAVAPTARSACGRRSRGDKSAQMCNRDRLQPPFSGHGGADHLPHSGTRPNQAPDRRSLKTLQQAPLDWLSQPIVGQACSDSS